MKPGISAWASAMPMPAISAVASSAPKLAGDQRSALDKRISSRAMTTPWRAPVRRSSQLPRKAPAPMVATGSVVSSEASLKLMPVAWRSWSSKGPMAARAGRRFRPTRMMDSASHSGR